MRGRVRLGVSLVALVLAASCGGESGTRGCQIVQGSPPPAPAIDPSAPMPLVTRGLPAFASAKTGDASKAVDGDYGTSWRSAHTPTPDDPDWLALDISSVPTTRRATVYSLWWNEAGYSYDTRDGHGYALPGDYRIQSNVSAGGTSPPASGWITMVTQSGNTLSSGAHLLHLSNANWVRFVATRPSSNAAPMNTDTSLQWELYDAHGAIDAWKFAGDSITANAMGHPKTNDGFNQLVHRSVPNFPAFEMAGHGGWGSAALLGVIDAYLANFPGRYFAIPLGTNDGDPIAFGNAMKALVTKVLAAGKVPVVPLIPYTGEPSHLAVIPKLNLEIEKLYVTFGPKLVRGPDLYTLLENGREGMFDKPTDLHPNAKGDLAIRQAWADAMVKNVYR
jgi:GDSL-like Lipase/Acylhydrolase family